MIRLRPTTRRIRLRREQVEFRIRRQYLGGRNAVVALEFRARESAAVTVIFALQVAVPLALILWLAIAPASDRVSLWSQVAATSLIVLAIALAGVWLFPPWWAPWVFALLSLGAALIAFQRRSAAPLWPIHRWRWGLTLLFASLAGFAAFQIANIVMGRQPPTIPLVELGFPLRGGTFLVVNGGNEILINAHLKTRDVAQPRFARWRGNGYGIDLVAIDRYGLRASGMRPADNHRYRIFGWPVLSPCDGKVILSIDDRPDMAPPEIDNREHLAGNHVLLICGDAHVVLAHFRRGSIKVRAGDTVRVGQWLGNVGNSGIGDEAHLHLHVQRPGTTAAPMSGEPLPASFFGRFLVRGDRLRVDAQGKLE
jgi:hypothetical protein